METPSSEASASVKPAQLLLNYDLCRKIDTLRSQLQAAKSKAENVRNMARLLRKATRDVMLLQISMNMVHGKSACSRASQLNHLHRQFCLSLKSTKNLAFAVEAELNPCDNLDSVIPFLRSVGDLVNALEEPKKMLFDKKVTTLTGETQSNETSETKQSALECHHGLKSPGQNSPNIKTEEVDDSEIKCSQVPSTPTIEDLQPQNGLSLEEHFKNAKRLRRKLHRAKRCDESLFISSLINGLDKEIYRRRITHTLRKETWDWAWLKHMVFTIILEEQYFEKQAYALAHQQEDGSVILPDGTKQKRFIVIEPITEEDLSTSEEEWVV
ncbi:hypothetical protein N7540_005083 [Penicillium herquei]|nr:hypothetical protein N7540_005083 [Penicillium herquei]